MSAFTAIDLSRLPAPNVVEALDYESILSAMQADLIARAPDLEAVLAVESDPLNKLLQVCAYREANLRQRVNDAARARMLAYATGSDLEHIAANYNETRRVLDPGDATAIPPVPPAYEDDETLRQRCLLAMEGLSNAGTAGSYTYHAMASDVRVKGASVVSDEPGNVLVIVLSTEGDGTASAELQSVVLAAVSADTVRPLCDAVAVQSAVVQTYAVEASLTVYPGPDASVVRQAAISACQQYASEHHHLGHDITLSGLYAALHQPGVHRVTLASPTEDIICDNRQAAYCTGINISVSGINE